jgi:hypothetical protein
MGRPGPGRGVLDLNDNALILDYTGASPRSQIGSLLADGYNGRTWNGNGITSSMAAEALLDPYTRHKTSVGFVEAAELGITHFAGRIVDDTAILVGYTYEGDANLDGKVDLLDLARLAAHWQQPNRDWSEGDFDFGRTVDVADLGLLASNWQAGAGSPPVFRRTCQPPQQVQEILLLAADRQLTQEPLVRPGVNDRDAAAAELAEDVAGHL